MELGHRIRDIRKQKKLTLVELSNLTGVAQASLSRIETGIMNGTVESHQKIAESLGMSLAELYSGIDKKLDEIAFRKEADTKQEVIIKNDDVKLELLTSQLNVRKFAPILVTMPSKKTLVYEKLERGTDKFFWIVSGSINVTLNNNDYTLNQNDTIYFDASYSHIVKNNNEYEAKILSVTSPAHL